MAFCLVDIGSIRSIIQQRVEVNICHTLVQPRLEVKIEKAEKSWIKAQTSSLRNENLYFFFVRKVNLHEELIWSDIFLLVLVITWLLAYSQLCIVKDSPAHRGF